MAGRSAMMQLGKVRVLAERPSRLVDYFREPRDIVVGGHLANRLGLQVMRTCVDHLIWSARRAEVDDEIRDAYETMSQDGVVVIPNFLPQEAFDAVKREFEATRTGAHRDRYKPESFGDNLVSEQLLVTDWPSDYTAHMRYLRDNPFLLKLASAVARRGMSFKPHLYTQVVYKPEPTKPHVDYNTAQFLHTDRHYPFVKAFFYLVDVDEKNAPYTFVPRSHKITGARLRYEYELSLRISKNRKNFDRRDDLAGQVDLHRRVYQVANRLRESDRLMEIPMMGKANTLIVSNNQGLHRRGDFEGDQPRVSVNLDYKYLESPAHRLYPVLKHLPASFRGE